MAVLLSLAEHGRCCDTRALGEAKLGMLRGKLDERAAAQRPMEALVSQCADIHDAHCPLINALLAGDEPPVQLATPRGGMPLAPAEAEDGALAPDAKHTCEP